MKNHHAVPPPAPSAPHASTLPSLSLLGEGRGEGPLLLPRPSRRLVKNTPLSNSTWPPPFCPAHFPNQRIPKNLRKTTFKKTVHFGQKTVKDLHKNVKIPPKKRQKGPPNGHDVASKTRSQPATMCLLC
jgi:hypothetical protein